MSKQSILEIIDQSTKNFAPRFGESKLKSYADTSFDGVIAIFVSLMFTGLFGLLLFCGLTFDKNTTTLGFILTKAFNSTAFPIMVCVGVAGFITLGRMNDFMSEIEIVKFSVENDLTKINPCLDEYSRVNTQNFSTIMTNLVQNSSSSYAYLILVFILGFGFTMLALCCCLAFSVW